MTFITTLLPAAYAKRGASGDSPPRDYRGTVVWEASADGPDDLALGTTGRRKRRRPTAFEQGKRQPRGQC